MLLLQHKGPAQAHNGCHQCGDSQPRLGRRRRPWQGAEQ